MLTSTLTVLANSDPFRGQLLTVLGSPSDFHSRSTPRCAYVSVINTSSFGRFWPVSWTITHCFGVPEWFPRLTSRGVRLRVSHQHSQFCPILACFVDYYSLFWGPRVIFTINEPPSAFTCRSPIILGLSDSVLFHGLLLTVLGSQNAFHGCRTPRSAMCWS